MRLSRFFRRQNEDAELAQELDAHLRHEIDDFVAQGLSPQEATRRAHLKLGSTTRVREDVWKWAKVGRPPESGFQVAPPSVDLKRPLLGPENVPFSHGPCCACQRTAYTVWGLRGSKARSMAPVRSSL